MHSVINSFSREITQHFDEYFSPHKLATSYVDLLLLIDKHEKVSQKQLAEELNLAPSTITRFIKKLEKKGLTGKIKEGRYSLITLSDKGNELIPELSEQYNKARNDLNELLGEKFVHTTEQLLKHGLDAMK